MRFSSMKKFRGRKRREAGGIVGSFPKLCPGWIQK
jgi:hypothetical protein